MAIPATVVNQFRQPHGVLGRLAGWTMAHRPSNRRRNLWMVDLLDIQPTDHVLELGCGPGIALAACAARATHGAVVGLDHSAQMLLQAAHRNARSIATGVTTLSLGNVNRLPPYSAVFDKVLSANLVQFLPDKVAVFREIHHIMRAGGRVATTYQPRSAHPSRTAALKMAEAITCAMQAAGFVDILTHELNLNPVPALCVIGAKASETDVTLT